jgi:hypothetical protein
MLALARYLGHAHSLFPQKKRNTGELLQKTGLPACESDMGGYFDYSLIVLMWNLSLPPMVGIRFLVVGLFVVLHQCKPRRL